MTGCRKALLLATLTLPGLTLAQAGPGTADPTSAPAAAPLPVRFAPERHYGPFVFVGDDGRLQGLSVDLLQRLAPLAGLRVQNLPAAPLAEQLALLRGGGADLVSSLRPTPERAAFLHFTVPYVRVPAIVVWTQGPPRTDGHAALGTLAGRPVAVGAGYAVEGFVRQRHAQVNWVAVPDDLQALQGVAQGRYAAAVVDAASAAFVARRHGIGGLVSAGPIGFDYALSFAAPLARADIVDRLDRAIINLPLQERSEIQQRWMGPLDDAALMAQPRQSSRLGAALLALAALLAAAGLWNWRRRTQASLPDRGHP